MYFRRPSSSTLERYLVSEPAVASDIIPEVSETTTIIASVSSERPTAALCLVPISGSRFGSWESGKTHLAYAILSPLMIIPPSWSAEPG